jgi:hypothetical protein
MTADLDALDRAAGEEDWESAQTAVLRIAQNELDLRLLYQPVIDVDLARLQLWTRQVLIDVAAEHTNFVLADAAALGRVWERIRHAVEPTGAVHAALQELQRAADGEDLPAVDRAATALNQAVGQLRVR